jgi:hypothetical protein
MTQQPAVDLDHPWPRPATAEGSTSNHFRSRDELLAGQDHCGAGQPHRDAERGDYRIEQQIAQLFNAHADQYIFAELPRSGMVRAATLLAKIGDCRERFPSDDALAALAGASPSTRQSGKRDQTVFRWACNK